MKQPVWDDLARTVIGYSLAVQAGEVVLICGSPTATPLIIALFRETIRRLGLPVVRLSEGHCQDILLNTSGCGRDRYLNLLKVADGRPVDCSIGIWSKDIGDVSGGANHVFNRGDDQRHVQSQFFQRIAMGHLRWTAILFPTQAAARDAGLSLTEFSKLVFAADMLDRPDPAVQWQGIHHRQQQLCESLERAHTIRFTSCRGTDLTLKITGRRWINGDGRRNLPDGEVFTSPHENGVCGVFYNSFPVTHEGHEIDGIRLEFSDGRVVGASAETGEESLIELLGQDSGSATVGEVAIGTNYRIARCTKTSLLDEKMDGSFHIALGASFPEAGGRNQSSIHRDFIADLRSGGQIFVDGRLINENGHFLNGEWARPEP